MTTRDKTIINLDRRVTEQAKRIEVLERALRRLLDVQDEPCSFDHNGYCQEHYLDHMVDGCRVADAKAALAGKPT